MDRSLNAALEELEGDGIARMAPEEFARFIAAVRNDDPRTIHGARPAPRGRRLSDRGG